MTGQAVICKLGEHIEIPGADFIVEVRMMGETVITQKDNKVGTLGILFDMETQLSHEMCYYNNLYSNSKLNADSTKKGYIGDNRRVRPVKLKGVKCSGFWMPLDSLSWLSEVTQVTPDSNMLTEGYQFNEVDGILICKKYVTDAQKNHKQGEGKPKTREKIVAPTFYEHIETDQWGRNRHKVAEDDYVIITDKLHGTSCRVGYLPVIRPLTKWQKFMYNYVYGPLTFGKIGKVETDTEYEYVIGSRRVLKSVNFRAVGGKRNFYATDIWTEASLQFEGKLYRGETVYFEIVGYLPDGSPIMPKHSNEKLKNFLSKEEYKRIQLHYGEDTVFSYNNTVGKYSIHIYRITTTNEDGVQFDLSWEQVKERSKEMGIKHVPELGRGMVREFQHDDHKGSEALNDVVEMLTDQTSYEFRHHMREGVCIRVETGAKQPSIYKNKAFAFKVLEGIIKDNEKYVDVEESN